MRSKSTWETCQYLNITIEQLRNLRVQLGLKGCGPGKAQQYAPIDIVRLKAGLMYKNYIFVQDMTRYWIWYGFSDTNEIKIEI